jgi:signal transduction histidine kinase
VGDRWLDTQNFPQLLLMPLLGIVRAPEQSPLVLGFMGWQRQQSLPWSTDELTLLDWVSSQVSTAIIHHNTLEQVQNLVDTRTAQLKGSLDVQARLYEKTRQQVEQQRKLIALKDEFLDSVSHELRTPLTSMKVAIRMLRNQELPVDRQAKYFELLEQEWQREYDLIQNLLRLQKLESSASILPLQEFDVYEFVTQLAYPFEKRWQPRELTLELDVPPDIQINSHRDSLERIITELLTNAGKYADAKSTIRLTVESRGAWVTFNVHNIGEGISEEHQEQVFEKFFRGDGVTKQAIAGTGLGLALVKALVKHINGFVTVKSRVANIDERGETCFSIRIPRNPLNLAPLTEI